MADIRNSGFGLNYNKGFGNGPAFVGGGMDPNSIGAASAYQKRIGDQQQNAFADNQLQKQLGYQREADQRDTAVKQEQMNAQQRVAQLQADASKYPAQLQQDRFNTVFPYLQQQLSGAQGGQGNGSFGYQGQGQVGTAPAIDASPVYSQQQIDQQVNSSRAANDAKTAGAQRKLQGQMAARGYGTNSPLAAELGLGLQNQNLATNTEAERGLRLDAATANSKQVLSGQQAQEQQFANRQQEDIERNKVYQSRYNSLIAALSGLV